MEPRRFQSYQLLSRFACTLFVLGATVSVTVAEPIEWTATTGGLFHTPQNWNPQSVPGPADTALFNQPSNYPVGLNDDASNDALHVSAGEVTFALGGRTYELLRNTTSSSDPGLSVMGSDVSLTIGAGTLGGELSAFTATLAGDGRLSVGGSSTLLDVKESLFVGGEDSPGTLALFEGASVSARQAFVGVSGGENLSFVSVFGSGSEWNVTDELQVSMFGSGTVQASFGGKVTTSSLRMAPFSGAQGRVIAIHDGALVHVQGDAVIGAALPGGIGDPGLDAQFGSSIVIDGELTYDHNSTVRASEGGLMDIGMVKRVGDESSGGIFVGKYGSLRIRSATSTFDLGIGHLQGNATIQIDGALDIDPLRSFIAAPSLASGSTLTVGSITGDGSFFFGQGTLNIGQLALGADPDFRDSLSIGSAQTVQSAAQGHTVNVANWTNIHTGGNLDITRFVANFTGVVLSEGSLNIDQSVTTFPGTGNLGSIGLGSSGSLRFSDSTINGGVIATEGSTLEVAGDVVFSEALRTQTNISTAANDRQELPLVTFDGGLTPGAGLFDNFIGQITIDADVVFGDSSTLAIKLDGASTGSYDAVAVTGSVQLDGELDVTLTSEYTPQFGDEFQFLTATTITNGFSSVNLPELGAGLLWDTDEVNDGLLRVVPTLTVLPAQLEFDGIEPGDVSDPETVVIQNTGDAVLEVSGLGFTGPAAPDFAVATEGCTDAPLGSGQSCTIEVAFQPSTPGGHTARLQIDIDPLTAPFDVELFGTTTLLFFDRFEE